MPFVASLSPVAPRIGLPHKLRREAIAQRRRNLGWETPPGPEAPTTGCAPAGAQRLVPGWSGRVTIRPTATTARPGAGEPPRRGGLG